MRTRSLRKKANRFSQAGPGPQSFCDGPRCRYTDIARMLPENPDVTPFIAYCLETEIKYEGYIKRQQSQIGAVKRQEETPIPEDFDYAPLTGLRLEAREKHGEDTSPFCGAGGADSGRRPGGCCLPCGGTGETAQK